MKVLIAEDDLISRKVLVKTIESWGHEVYAAENGLQAWEIFQREKPKFIIADWIMPEMEGIELCRKIRTSGQSGYIYFILLTGKDKKEEVIEGLQAGADDYVPKPFDIEELRVRVRTGERILELEKKLNEKNDELEELNRQLEILANTDPLMQIGNRRAFYAAIAKVHQRACRYPHNYGVIMIDIDNFKNYNDTYGHAAGDKVLSTVATTLKDDLRCSDEIFRWGGEEIVVILMEQGLQETAIVAEKLRQRVEDLRIKHKECDLGYVSISLGVSAFRKDCIDKQWEIVLDRADKALYQAKESGRNRVCSNE